jgi:hypothetical protein
MQYKIITIALIAVLTSLTACQKVINLNLKDVTGKYVVEGNVTDLPGPYQVKLSQVGRVEDDYTFNGVSHAQVTIRDDAGNNETLQEVQPGIYQTSTLAGVEGRTYYLNISLGSNTFTSASVMPHRVNFDSLYVEEVYNFSKMVKAAVPVYTDPPQKGNSYRFNQYINGTLDKTLYQQNDDFTNGNVSSWSLLRPDADSTLHVNDHVSVEMQCIDSAVYNYWNSAQESSTGDGSSIASNPVTNIQGGALGYFSAHTSQTRSIIVK